MRGRILRAVLLVAGALLLPTAGAMAETTLTTQPYGISCAIAGDCVAVGDSAVYGDYTVQYDAGTWSTSPTSGTFSTPFCSPVSCILAPREWGGTWDRESDDTFSTLAANPKLPANAVVADGATDLSGSCTWPDDCTFTASYTIKGGTSRDPVGGGLFLTEQGGKWGADAEPNWSGGDTSQRDVQLESISCSRPGFCSAAGYYEYNFSRDEGLLLTESNGKWGHDAIKPLPTNYTRDDHTAQHDNKVHDPAYRTPADPAQIACGSAPYCIAIGAYGVYVERPEAKNIYGVWVKKTVPSGLDADAVACSLTGNCVIAGGTSSNGTLLEQADGAWKPLQTVRGVGQFTDVTCPAVGSCVAISDSSIESESDGKWTTEPAITAPEDANVSADMQLVDVSCQSAGNCFAFGTYTNDSSAQSNFLVTETDGVWNTAAVTFPIPAAI